MESGPARRAETAGSGLTQRHGGPIGLLALAAILLLGLGLRLNEAWDGRPPVYDAAAYAAIAENLADGGGFTVGAAATQPSSNYSPGVPLLVAGLYELTGPDERAARVLLALLGTLSVLLAYALARRLGRSVNSPHRGVVNSPNGGGFEVAAGLVAAAGVAVYPALVEYQGMLMGEPLAATLLAGSVLAMLWAWDAVALPMAGAGTSGAVGAGTSGAAPDRPAAGWPRWLLAGLLLGGLTLVRPEYLGISVLLALVVFLRRAREDPRGSLARAAILLAGLVIVVAPWTLRNAVALDRFVPVSTGGGQVLFAGTYLPSDGDPEVVGREVVAENPALFAPADAERLRLEQILARLAAERHPDLETDQALSRMGREQLWDDLSGRPLDYAGFVATKAWRIWAHGPRAVMREPGWELLHWALVALGLTGLGLLAWRRRWEALLIATIFLAITALSALLVASPRRVLVLVPLLAALAGTAVAWAAASWRASGELSRSGPA